MPQLSGDSSYDGICATSYSALFSCNRTIRIITLRHSTSPMSTRRGRPRRNVPPCRFCQKQFRRSEHLERHERTRMIPSLISASMLALPPQIALKSILDSPCCSRNAHQIFMQTLGSNHFYATVVGDSPEGISSDEKIRGYAYSQRSR